MISTAVSEWLTSPSGVVQLVAGLLLLLAGRRLYWLLVAAIGFFAGLGLAETYLNVDSVALEWLLALLTGALAALVAVFLQKFAISAAGAVAAGYATWWYLSLNGTPLGPWHWAAVAGATVVGLLIARTVFDFGLIFVSSLAGATLILESLGPEASTSRWLFLILVVAGTVIQSYLLGKRESRK